MRMAEVARQIVARFLHAVEARDVDGVVASFAADGVHQNVPHPPTVGHAAIRAVFARILGRSERVEWEILDEIGRPGQVWLERIDRFWIDGAEYAIECNGIFEVDEAAGVITVFRDYLDLAVWRDRLGDALA
jgi:limonene-1,2-epoxide hydrolase